MLSDNFNPGYLRQLELLNIRARRTFLGARHGGHLSMKRGHGIEFSDYRKYEPGDSPRHIDWGVYGRSDKLYVKRFQEEQALSFFIACDGTRSMLTPTTAGKWEFARDIALSLSYVALMQHDSVRICVPGVMTTPAFSHGRGIHTLSDLLDKATTGNRIDFIEEFNQGLHQVKFPGVGVLISDLLMPFEVIQKAVNAMRAKNLDINVIQVLSDSDLDPLENETNVIAIDSETGDEVRLELSQEARAEYSYRLEQHNLGIKEFLANYGISYSLALTSQTVQEFVIQHLARTGLLA